MTVSTHNFTATYQEGIVSQVDAKRHKVRCKIPALDDLETDWLSFLTQNSGGNQFYCLPDVGELVAILLDARGEGGCVLGTMYNEQDPTPASSNDMWGKWFNNKTLITHDRKTGNITVFTKGNGNETYQQLTITAKGGVVINADVTINGNLHITGTSTADVDHISNGTSGHSHTHTQNSGNHFGGGATTTPPN